MAIVTKLVHGTRNIRPHPTETECEYQALVLSDGSSALQLSTFGSSNRTTEGVSQTLQFTAAAAQELMSALEQVFPSIRWKARR